MDNGYEEIIEKVLMENNIEFTPKIKEEFEYYYQFLISYNEHVNLTAITDKKEVYIKHFADCLLGLKYIKNRAWVCDIGTGAGFPGLVLKLVRPDIRLVLVDSLQKRVAFLNQIVAHFNLEGVTILHNRAEDVDFKNNYLNKFDCVVSRAVAPLNILVEYCLPFVKMGGVFISYKGIEAEKELNESGRVISLLGGKTGSVESFPLVNDIYRKFIVIDKVRATSGKYPRGNNKPRKAPIL